MIVGHHLAQDNQLDADCHAVIHVFNHCPTALTLCTEPQYPSFSVYRMHAIFQNAFSDLMQCLRPTNKGPIVIRQREPDNASGNVVLSLLSSYGWML